MRKPPPSETASIAVVHDPSKSWGRRIISGVLEYAQQHTPWQITIIPVLIDDAVPDFGNWRGDGIITRITGPETVKAMKKTGLPIVNVGMPRPIDAPFPRVSGNTEEIASMAADFFCARQYTHFACVGEIRKGLVRSCLEAYCELLASRGHACLLQDLEAPARKIKAWLTSLPKPVALFVWGADAGRRIIEAARAAGLTVPHEVAVLGSDYDDLINEASFPAQSGIQLAPERIGRAAAKVMDDILRGRKPGKRDLLLGPVGIVERASTDSVAVSNPAMAAVSRYVLAHALEPISIDDVIKAHPMARRSLERKFRETFGCTIIEQIRGIRVSNARRLLEHSDMPVTQIAEKCGFGSYNYMGRVFREAIGLSPSECRDRALRSRSRRA